MPRKPKQTEPLSDEKAYEHLKWVYERKIYMKPDVFQRFLKLRQKFEGKTEARRLYSD